MLKAFLFVMFVKKLVKPYVCGTWCFMLMSSRDFAWVMLMSPRDNHRFGGRRRRSVMGPQIMAATAAAEAAAAQPSRPPQGIQ
jgi:hypothetical protein